MNEIKDEVAKALGVDAVIEWYFESEQSKIWGAAIATAVLLEVLEENRIRIANDGLIMVKMEKCYGAF
jgi:hypothetical protein